MSKFKILNDSIRINIFENKAYTLTVTGFIPKLFIGVTKNEDDSNYGVYISNLFTGILFNSYDYGYTLTLGILGFKIDIWWAR